jgi:hypothetical protein
MRIITSFQKREKSELHYYKDANYCDYCPGASSFTDRVLQNRSAATLISLQTLKAPHFKPSERQQQQLRPSLRYFERTSHPPTLTPPSHCWLSQQPLEA